MNFTIKSKDSRGRIGTFETAHGFVRTPNLMPVIHPGKQTIDISKFDADIVITNAYLIYKDEKLKSKALNNGVHDLINFDGSIMTDSGSYQLSVYGDVEVNNQEIIEFQEAIKTDIGTSLDIPTPPYSTRTKTEEDLKVTLNRAKEAKGIKDNKKMNMLLNSVVQGSTFPDLRSKSAKDLSALNCDIYPIGAIVPLMESYHYSDLVDVIMSSVSNLPDSKPRHLMGAGHPMLFSLAVAMGCDLFDSAAYILYAKNDRFLTIRGTYKLGDLHEMPCSCEVCSKYTPDDLRAMDKKERTRLIAEHNLHVSFAEIRVIRQAIIDGSLMELVEERSRVHPTLLNAYRKLGDYSNNLEVYEPRVKKSAFFYSGAESLKRPEVTRHLIKLDEMNKKRDLAILPPYKKPYSNHLPDKLGDFYVYGDEMEIDLDNIDFMVADIPFGLVPLNIDEAYPLSQHESPKIKDIDGIEFVKSFLLDFVWNYSQILIHSNVAEDYQLCLYRTHPQSNIIDFKINDHDKIKAIADYQFGNKVGDALFKGEIEIEKSKKTGKIRHVYCDGKLVANMRASDSYFVLAKKGAIRLHKAIKFPKNRVVVNADSEPFTREGKSVFSKFVLNCDSNIRANDEVLIVNENDDLLAFGKSLLNCNEMMNFNVGQAIKNRSGYLRC
ncbi:MAG: tRNA guanosine(15) transglycosylase TgtA [Methanobrevibacter sp.]|jgi:7-cyano-7-deazaguanine tRNA-ribosyltransferase|nr:tRNA guanosine(15) transglycosylase TgtA [Candidatus Methanovirga basalitermitum]